MYAHYIKTLNCLQMYWHNVRKKSSMLGQAVFLLGEAQRHGRN